MPPFHVECNNIIVFVTTRFNRFLSPAVLTVDEASVRDDPDKKELFYLEYQLYDVAHLVEGGVWAGHTEKTGSVHSAGN